MAVLYTQNFGAGLGDQGFGVAFYQSSDFGGPDTPDTVYPELAITEACVVVSGSVEAGKWGLTTSGAGNWGVGACLFAEIGNEANGWWDADTGILKATYLSTAGAWDEGSVYAPLLELARGDVAADFYAAFSFTDTVSGSIDIRHRAWRTGSIDYTAVVTLTRAVVEDELQTFELRWQCGTVLVDPPIVNADIAEDGWVELWLNGVRIWDVRGVDLYMSDVTYDVAAPPPAVNRMRWAGVGWSGLFGPVTDLSLENAITMSANTPRLADGVIRTAAITSIDADGFTVGAEQSQAATSHWWQAFDTGEIADPAALATGGTFEADVPDVYADEGIAYISRVVSKQFVLGGILRRFGVLAGAMLVSPASGEELTVKLIRDYGRSTVTKTVDLTPGTASGDSESGSAYLLRQLDDLSMSDLLALQIELTDLGGTFGWSADQIVLKMSDEEGM